MAHNEDIQVVPLVGPSSILLALMASGMNGQSLHLLVICQSKNLNEKRNCKVLKKIKKLQPNTNIY